MVNGPVQLWKQIRALQYLPGGTNSSIFCHLEQIVAITGFLEDSPVLLGLSLLALRVLLFMQKFRDFLYMQSTETVKQNKQQRPSSKVHNTHTTREERSW